PELIWASEIGRDRYGLFSAFIVPGTSVAQRLRWIPPGRFIMGSPENEVGRYNDEGPRHEVMIGAGFWLFDTPCTQGLWEAVMGRNPSRFAGPKRPVEQVSFEDVSHFLERLNAMVPGLELSLPSEARWEYACRAGTAAATWTGDLGKSMALLDPIAWYEENSG